MVLNLQILSFTVSFLYGIFFNLTLRISSKYIYSSFMFLKIVSSFLFVIFHTLLYFLILIHINYGYLHFYFFLFILFGYIVCQVLYKWFEKRNKR